MIHIPTVCVSMIVYNQRAFVAQAIDSVLSQRTDFPVVLHIGDDFSTDGTREIITLYRDLHPDRIVLNLAETRGGGRVGRENNVRNINSCRKADYIALLDGDDYWIDQNKLQSQVDFLERFPSYPAIGHDAFLFHEDTGQSTGLVSDSLARLVGKKPVGEDIDLDQDMLFRFIPQTSTLCLRTSALPPFPTWFWNVPAADRAIAMLLAETGPIRFDRRAMSVYRIHAASEWQTITKGPSRALSDWDAATFEYLLGAFPVANRGRNRAQFELMKVKNCINAYEFARATLHVAQALRHHAPTVAATAKRILMRLLQR